MNRLNLEDQIRVISALVEGNSIRSTVRMTGVAKKTVLKLLVNVGRVCWVYQHKNLTGLTTKRVECDEIWSFCYSKQGNIPDHLKGKYGVGDVWTWVAMDSDNKLVIAWNIGKRDAGTGFDFMHNLAKRLKNRIQLSTDGHRVYLDAVEGAFGSHIDYGQLVKIYGKGVDASPQHRYSPTECVGAQKHALIGRPRKGLISTSYVERQNLTMRMQMRRFTRLTNAFSKKISNHWWAVSLHFMAYNFCRVHGSLNGKTPAMAAGVTDNVWSIEDILRLLAWNRKVPQPL